MIQTFSMLLVSGSEMKVPEANGHGFGCLFWSVFVCLDFCLVWFMLLFFLWFLVLGLFWLFCFCGF